jgi:hypothetical protein
VALRAEPTGTPPVALVAEPTPEDTPGTVLPGAAPLTASAPPRLALPHLAAFALIAAGFLYVAFRILIAR